jgi:predicted enzyme related to lactoylglutathione lyase
MSPPNTVVWFELHVSDMARARAFYEGVFGQTLVPMDVPEGAGDLEMMAFPSDPPDSAPRYGACGALVRHPGVAAGGTGGTVVYFGCADCAVEAARVEAHGGTLMQGKTAIGPHGHFALARDTEGNVIGLHSM